MVIHSAKPTQNSTSINAHSSANKLNENEQNRVTLAFDECTNKATRRPVHGQSKHEINNLNPIKIFAYIPQF